MKDYLNFNFDLNDSEFVSVYDELPLWSAPFGLTLLDTISYKKTATVLDIGCGTGFPLVEIAGRFGNSSKIYGIDPWEKALERISLKLEKYKIKNVYLIKGTAEKMPFENNFFDLIVSNNGINNVDNPEIALKEVFRVCKNYGQFVYTVNLPGTMKEFYDIFEITLNEFKMFDEIEKMKEHIIKKRKPVEVLKKMTEDSGFKIKNVIENSFNMKFIDGTAMLNYHFIRSHFVELWKNIIDDSKQYEIFDKLENNLNESAKKQGQLKLQIPFICFDCYKT